MENRSPDKEELSIEKMNQVSGGDAYSDRCRNYLPGLFGACKCANYVKSGQFNCSNFRVI